jgi:hypothetical protein
VVHERDPTGGGHQQNRSLRTVNRGDKVIGHPFRGQKSPVELQSTMEVRHQCGEQLRILRPERPSLFSSVKRDDRNGTGSGFDRADDRANHVGMTTEVVVVHGLLQLCMGNQFFTQGNEFSGGSSQEEAFAPRIVSSPIVLIVAKNGWIRSDAQRDAGSRGWDVNRNEMCATPVDGSAQAIKEGLPAFLTARRSVKESNEVEQSIALAHKARGRPDASEQEGP